MSRHSGIRVHSNTVVRDPILATPVRVTGVATPVAPSTEYKYMKHTTNKLTLKLTLKQSKAKIVTKAP